jgi:hypothetical protein
MKNKFKDYSWDDLSYFIIKTEAVILKTKDRKKSKNFKKQLSIAEKEKEQRLENMFIGGVFLLKRELNLVEYLENELEELF